jgi:DNA-binding transcriptional regulator YdaS (Cro superfamily)
MEFIMCKGGRAKMDSGLKAAIEAAGSKYRLAQSLGIRPQALQTWRRVPPARVLEIEAIWKVPREVLRPDLYAPPRPPGVKSRS